MTSSNVDKTKAENIVQKHRRHVELTPGVGAEVQKYALAVCDDILSDLAGVPSADAEVLKLPTQEGIDAVRGILQVLRGKPGATFADVGEHCSLRGDELDRWPRWILESEGFVNEQAAACMIYEVMQAHQPAPRVSSATTALAQEVIAAAREIPGMKIKAGTQLYPSRLVAALKALDAVTGEVHGT